MKIWKKSQKHEEIQKFRLRDYYIMWKHEKAPWRWYEKALWENQNSYANGK